MRKYISIIAAIVILLAGFSIASASGYFNFSSASQINFTSGSQININAPTGTIYGYSSHPTISQACTGSRNTFTIRLMVAAGASQQRTDFQWETVEATSSSSDVWGNYDCMISDFAAAGIKTVPLLITWGPSWSQYPGCSGGTHCAPANASDFGQWCGKFASHYASYFAAGDIPFVEIGNEVNDNSNWEPAATSSDYVAAFNSCASAIKAVVPSALVSTDGLDESVGDPTKINYQTSVSDYIADGANFDLIALHPYSANINSSGSGGWGTEVDSIRAILNAAGKSSIPIAITEFGGATCDALTLNQQRNIALQAIATSTNAYSNIWQPIFWYTVYDQDSTDASQSQENCFGAYYTDGQPKPVYEALRSL